MTYGSCTMCYAPVIILFCDEPMPVTLCNRWSESCGDQLVHPIVLTHIGLWPMLFSIKCLVMRVFHLLGATLTRYSLLLYAMDNHDYAHIVATFMQQCFQSRLAQVTRCDIPPSMPATPIEIDSSLYHACLFAVERCLCAFTNPSMFAFIS